MRERAPRSPIPAAVALVFALACGGPGGLGPSRTTPERVFEGGGGRLQIELVTNQPAVLKTGFSQYDEATDEERSVDSAEELAPGSYVRSIDVSPATYVYLEVGVPEATPGASLSWSISIDGQRVLQDSDTLEEPLGPGYAFFLQAEADDVQQMRGWR